MNTPMMKIFAPTTSMEMAKRWFTTGGAFHVSVSQNSQPSICSHVRFPYQATLSCPKIFVKKVFMGTDAESKEFLYCFRIWNWEIVWASSLKSSCSGMQITRALTAFLKKTTYPSKISPRVRPKKLFYSPTQNWQQANFLIMIKSYF